MQYLRQVFDRIKWLFLFTGRMYFCNILKTKGIWASISRLLWVLIISFFLFRHKFMRLKNYELIWILRIDPLGYRGWGEISCKDNNVDNLWLVKIHVRSHLSTCLQFLHLYGHVAVLILVISLWCNNLFPKKPPSSSDKVE